MRNNWFDFIDTILFQRGSVDISSVNNEEIENMTFDEYEDVTYERINQ